MPTASASAPDAPPSAASLQVTGVACGAGAGALWGLVLLAPELAGDFSPLLLTIGRYVCFGLIAAAIIAPRWRPLLAGLTRQQWLSLGWLALTGNTLYYILLASAVQSGGIAMTSLVIGFLPVAVTIIGSRDHGAVSLQRLLPSLLFCVLGAICIGAQALGHGASTPLGEQSFGLACAVGALASWTAFAVGNTRCLAQVRHLSSHDWNLLVGLVTGLQALVLIPAALVIGTGEHGAGDWARFGAVSAGLAVLASILGNLLWNRMSRLLPLTLVGQMILFETLFALIYGLLWESRLPTLLEVSALVCVVLGVLSCLAAHRQPAILDAGAGAH